LLLVSSRLESTLTKSSLKLNDSRSSLELEENLKKELLEIINLIPILHY
jgi:hypothetical protein